MRKTYVAIAFAPEGLGKGYGSITVKAKSIKAAHKKARAVIIANWYDCLKDSPIVAVVEVTAHGDDYIQIDTPRDE